MDIVREVIQVLKDYVIFEDIFVSCVTQTVMSWAQLTRPEVQLHPGIRLITSVRVHITINNVMLYKHVHRVISQYRRKTR